jgi:hypothetical protein
MEVSEKRGRHWVRLPFACGLRVLGEVVLNAEVGLVMAYLGGRKRPAEREMVRGKGFGHGKPVATLGFALAEIWGLGP